MPRKAAPKPRYSPHPGLAMEARAKAKLLETTGRSFDQLVALARAEGPAEAAKLRTWLRAEHGVSSMNAWWIASAALGEGQADYGEPEPFVDALYAGPREALRPLHERIVDEALRLGDDVIVTACKTMVPIYRKHVFAELRPVEGGVLVHLALGDVAAAGRLEPADGRGPGERLTHRLVVRSAKDLDGDFRAWLAQAYAAGAGRMSRGRAEAKLPADLAAALAKSRAAKATWETCTAAMRRDFIAWIDSAKQAATRERRVGQAVEKLAAGKKRIY